MRMTFKYRMRRKSKPLDEDAITTLQEAGPTPRRARKRFPISNAPDTHATQDDLNE